MKLNTRIVPKYKATLTDISTSESQYGQEVAFEWTVEDHPYIKIFNEKFTLGSESYGERAFTKLSKAVKALTGEELTPDGELNEEKLLNLQAWISFGFYNQKEFISSRTPIKEDTRPFSEQLGDELPL